MQLGLSQAVFTKILSSALKSMDTFNSFEGSATKCPLIRSEDNADPRGIVLPWNWIGDVVAQPNRLDVQLPSCSHDFQFAAIAIPNTKEAETDAYQLWADNDSGKTSMCFRKTFAIPPHSSPIPQSIPSIMKGFV